MKKIVETKNFTDFHFQGRNYAFKEKDYIKGIIKEFWKKEKYVTAGGGFWSINSRSLDTKAINSFLRQKIAEAQDQATQEFKKKVVDWARMYEGYTEECLCEGCISIRELINK